MFLRKKRRPKDGTYEVGIVGIRKHKSRNGNKGLIIRFEVLPGNEDEGIIFESRIPLNSNHPYPLIYKLIDSLCDPYEAGIRIEEIIYRACEIDVRVEGDYINIVDIRRLNHEDWEGYYEGE